MQFYVLLNNQSQVVRRLQQPEDWPLEEGFIVDDGSYPPAPPPVPASVSRAQLKLALIEAGLYQRTVDYVNTRANFPDEATWKKVQVNWADRLTFERQHSVVLMLMQALGVSSDQADALWITAANL